MQVRNKGEATSHGVGYCIVQQTAVPCPGTGVGVNAVPYRIIQLYVRTGTCTELELYR
jgi:hypothetical protein